MREDTILLRLMIFSGFYLGCCYALMPFLPTCLVFLRFAKSSFFSLSGVKCVYLFQCALLVF